MAVSEIHAVRCTPSRVIAYIMRDKVVKISSKDEVFKDCDHEIFMKGQQMYVRYKTYSQFQSVSITNPVQDFTTLQKKFQYSSKGDMSRRSRSKNGEEPLAWHCHVSFKGRECSPEIANEFAWKLSNEVFQGFPVVMSTHTNGDNIHCHFAISAWNLQGKKWNNCHATTQQIRDVTDRLCKEYGLSVLHDTSRMKLQVFDSKSGKKKIWEPTPRKVELAKLRDEDFCFPDDVNSFRNTDRYAKWKSEKVNQADIVKRDIDSLLPRCTSFDDLIRYLRQLGYTVRAKKKDGGWMAHISYQCPEYEKAVREDKIGDGKFYLRLNLTKYIKENAAHLQEKEHSSNSDSIPFYDDYRYSKISVSSLRDDYFKLKLADGSVRVKPRTEWQRKAIRSIREDDHKVRQLLDTTELHKLVADQERLSDGKKKYRTDTEAARYVAQIENTFAALHSAEQNDFRGYGQMLDAYKSIRQTYDKILDEQKMIEKLLDDRHFVVDIPKHIDALEKRIDSKKGNVEYILEQYRDDLRTLEQMKDTFRRLKLDQPDELNKYSSETERFEERFADIQIKLAAAELKLNEVDNCIRTYARIDSNLGIDVSDTIRMFNKLTHGEYEEFERDYESRYHEHERT